MRGTLRVLPDASPWRSRARAAFFLALLTMSGSGRAGPIDAENWFANWSYDFQFCSELAGPGGTNPWRVLRPAIQGNGNPVSVTDTIGTGDPASRFYRVSATPVP